MMLSVRAASYSIVVFAVTTIMFTTTQANHSLTQLDEFYIGT